MGDDVGDRGGRAGVRTVRAAVGVDGEEKAGGESEYPDDVLAGAFSLALWEGGGS